MRRNLDFRNHREKLDQNSTKTNQNSKKNFGRKFWSTANLAKCPKIFEQILSSSDFVADGLKRCAIKNEYDMQNLKTIGQAVFQK